MKKLTPLQARKWNAMKYLVRVNPKRYYLVREAFSSGMKLVILRDRRGPTVDVL